MTSLFVDPRYASAESFVNRTKDVTMLIRHATTGCRVCTVYGVGGVGKSALAYQFAMVQQDEFQATMWYSLTNAPPLADLISSMLSQFPDETPDDGRSPTEILLGCLSSRRYLIVLDNLEVLLDSERFPNQFRPGYEDYGPFLRQLASAQHSCMVLITSREKPQLLRDDHRRVHSLRLSGLSRAPARMLLARRPLRGDVSARTELIARYAGNPLAISLAADLITELHGGDISDFLNSGDTLFSDLEALLQQHFRRLSPEEKLIMYRLAVSRQPLTVREIGAKANLRQTRAQTTALLQQLLRRSLVIERNGRFLLQYMILEFITAQLISSLVEEITSDEPQLLGGFALVDAAFPEFVRQSQRRFVATPVIERLREQPMTTGQISIKLKRLLDRSRADQPHHGSYAAANSVSLHAVLDADLAQTDLSRLVLRQLDLSNVRLTWAIARDTEFDECRFPGTYHYIFAMQFSPEGGSIALGQSGGDVVIVSVPGGVRLKTLPGTGEFVRALAYTPDGTRLACTNDRGELRLWNLSTDLPIELTGPTRMVRSISFSSDGNTLFAGGTDPRLFAWSLTGPDRRPDEASIVSELEGGIWGIDTAPAEPIVAVAGDKFGVALWDFSTSTRLPVEVDGAMAGRWVRFNSAGDHVIVGCDDNKTRIWRVSSGELVAELEGHTAPVWGLSAARRTEGDRLITGGRDGTIRIWDIGEPALTRSLRTIRVDDGWVWPVDTDPEGEVFAAASSNTTIRFWDSESGDCLEVLNGMSRLILSVAASPDGRVVATGSHDSMVRLWDPRTGHCIKELPGHQAGVRAVAFDPSGTKLASASEDWDVRLWDVATLSPMARLTGSRNWLYTVAFDATGRFVAAGGADLVARVWDLHGGELVHEFHGHAGMIRNVAFAPDGSVLYSAAEDGDLRRWDLDTESGVVVASADGQINCLQVIGQDQVITGSGDGAIRSWRTSDGTCLAEADAHPTGVLSLSLSPDRGTLASAGHDGEVRHWSLPELAPLGDARRTSGPVRTITHLANTDVIAYAGMDEAVRLARLGNAEDDHALRIPRQFEGLDITGTTGISTAQRQLLVTLGAVDAPAPEDGPDVGRPEMDARTRHTAVKVFVSYSHRDENLRRQLDSHLSALQWQGVIDSWHDRQIPTGSEWRREIDATLEAADIILLLISADFLASTYCRDIEMARALERHHEGTAWVVPVILRECDWRDLPFAELQSLPRDGRPITSFANRDAALTDVARGIRRVAETIREQRAGES